jgi:exosortase
MPKDATLTTEHTEGQHKLQRRFFVFASLLSFSFFLWWSPLATTFRIASTNDAQTYILLVLPLGVALAYYDLRKSVSVGRRSTWIGWTLLLAAVIIRITGLASSTPSIHLSVQMLALVFWWFGAVINCFGFPRFKLLLFPLCFFLLLVPVPKGILDWMAEWLQQETAVTTTVLFKAARVPVTRDGVMLSIPELDIEVARECSSIRSSTLLFVTTLVLAHLFLHSWWRKWLLVLLAIPLSVAKNAVRIFTIAELGTRVDPGFLNGRLHHNGGVVFLALAMTAQILFLWLLMKSETHVALRKMP